jgi:hypothetical protein
MKPIIKEVFLLLLVLLAAFTFSIPWHQGFTLGDCADYLNAAHKFNKGVWDIETNYYANRVGTFLPYAIAMKIGGLGTWLTWITTSLFALFLILVYCLLRTYDKQVAFATVSLMALSPLLLRNASVVMGDIAAMFTTNFFVLVIFYFRFYVEKNYKAAIGWGIVAAVLFFFCFWVKESVVFFIPFVAWLWFKGRNIAGEKPFWKALALGLIVSGIIIGLIYYIKTGNPLYRFMAVEGGPTASDCNYKDAPWSTIFKRITYQPLQFIFEDLWTAIVFTLSVIYVGVSIKKPTDPQGIFFREYFLIMVAIWWVGSQGISSYNPVALVHRIWMPVYLPATICAAIFLVNSFNDELVAYRRLITAIAVILLLLVVVTFVLSFQSLSSIGDSTEHLMYSRVYLIVVIVLIVSSNYIEFKEALLPPLRRLIFLIIILLFFLQNQQHLIWWANKQSKSELTDYEYEKEIVLAAINENANLILTDYWLSRNYGIYTGFNANYPFVNYNHHQPNGDRILLMLNKKRQQEALANITETRTYTTAKNEVADFAVQPQQYGFKVIRENQEAVLYRLENAEGVIK